MPIYEFEGKRPKIGATSWVHPTAVIIGNVTIGERCWIGPNATVRADTGTIHIGDGTNLQDNVVVHGLVATIGSFVTVGHSAVVHGCTIGDHVLVAMNATVLDNARVGDWSVVAAGSVVAPRAVIPPYKMVMGVPASVVSDIPKERVGRFNPEPEEGYLLSPIGIRRGWWS